MIISIDHLKPLEEVFLHHLKNLSEMILKEGIVHTPIIADKKVELFWMVVIDTFFF